MSENSKFNSKFNPEVITDLAMLIRLCETGCMRMSEYNLDDIVHLLSEVRRECMQELVKIGVGGGVMIVEIEKCGKPSSEVRPSVN